MTKLGVCGVCHKDIIREEYSDYTIEGCSKFCADTTPEEKAAFVELKPGEFGVWPCSECSCAIEDEYDPNGYCSSCSSKVTIRKLNEKISLLEKDLVKNQNEALLWKKEAEAAYKYNKDLNKWWQFKVDRLKLTHQHNNSISSLPWKKVAKKLFLQSKKINQECDRLNQQYNELVDRINTTNIADFVQSMTNESAYQKDRWLESDKTKTDADWFWLIGYLSSKALFNPDFGNASLREYAEKQKHRIVTIAAAAYHWWNAKNSKEVCESPKLEHGNTY